MFDYEKEKRNREVIRDAISKMAVVRGIGGRSARSQRVAVRVVRKHNWYKRVKGPLAR